MFWEYFRFSLCKEFAFVSRLGIAKRPRKITFYVPKLLKFRIYF